MPKRDRIPELPPAARLAFAGEILGAPVRLPASRHLRRAVDGVVVDETLQMLHVRVAGRPTALRVPKAGLEGTIVLGARELPLKGDTLRVRPEDRTKRLLARGPRRFR
jgi:RNase P/RNase MRP subunit p29